MTDNYAHLGGLGAGFVLGLVCARPLEPSRRLRQSRPRAIAGVAFAVTAVVFAFISIPKCSWLAQERAFLQVRQTVGTLEDQYISNYNQIQEDSRNGKITDVIAPQRAERAGASDHQPNIRGTLTVPH